MGRNLISFKAAMGLSWLFFPGHMESNLTSIKTPMGLSWFFFPPGHMTLWKDDFKQDTQQWTSLKLWKENNWSLSRLQQDYQILTVFSPQDTWPSMERKLISSIKTAMGLSWVFSPGHTTLWKVIWPLSRQQWDYLDSFSEDTKLNNLISFKTAMGLSWLFFPGHTTLWIKKFDLIKTAMGLSWLFLFFSGHVMTLWRETWFLSKNSNGTIQETWLHGYTKASATPQSKNAVSAL